jgi:hypothetical protein
VKSTATNPRLSRDTAPVDTGEQSILSDAEDRLNRIPTAAYYSAKARGFAPGMELDDWLQAEANFG